MANHAKTPDELAELLYQQSKGIAKKIYRGKVSAMTMRHGIILFAHANWEKLEPLYRAQTRYATAEGLDVEAMWQKMISRKVKA